MLTICIGTKITRVVSRKPHTLVFGKKPPVTLNRFAASKPLLSSDAFRQIPSTQYMIPDHFWTDVCQESNGFFGCQDKYDKGRKLKSHNIEITSTPHGFLLTADDSHVVPIFDKAGRA